MLCDCEFGEHPIICHNEQNMFQTGEEENIRPKEHQYYEKGSSQREHNIIIITGGWFHSSSSQEACQEGYQEVDAFLDLQMYLVIYI